MKLIMKWMAWDRKRQQKSKQRKREQAIRIRDAVAIDYWS